jgi:hypothetical protein
MLGKKKENREEKQRNFNKEQMYEEIKEEGNEGI